MRTGELPDLYTYLSYRRYLVDWFEARKAADHRFSHRLFVRRAGASSPSLLREIIDGKRNLSPAMTDGFARALGLGASASAFFRDLVALDQAPGEAERNAAWQRISAHRRFHTARSIDGAAFAYLSHWYLPATRELALRPDFRPDPEWIAATLWPPVPVVVAREALEVLFALGLLVERDGRVSPADTSVATPHQVQGLAVHNYHRGMLERAIDAIAGVRAKERHLVGVTVAVPESLVPALKAELDAVQERLLDLCDARASEAERVYQIELCLFPLSRAVEEPR
ncbi:MAG: TIGR02147 family protein [Myxococcota bacterium]